MWPLLSTTKESFTIPNILPYVHHWQCGLCCPLPKTDTYLTICPSLTMWSLLSTTKEPFTIPNILPYVHHWQCGLCCPLPNSLLQYLTSYHKVVFVGPCPSLTMWSLLSTTKQSFTIPNILPYVHHWQCGLCCPLPKSLLQYLTSYHMSITDNVAFVVHYQRAFTIPNILPYVHHWQCGLCCPLPKSFYNT